MSMSGRSNVELNNEQKCAMHGISHHSWISVKKRQRNDEKYENKIRLLSISVYIFTRARTAAAAHSKENQLTNMRGGMTSSSSFFLSFLTCFFFEHH